MAGNTSGLTPKGRAVLIEPYEPEVKKGMIVLPQATKERGAMLEQRAVVVEIGPDAWKNPGESPRAVPGEKVLVAKFSGYMAVGTADGKQYRFVNCNDIFAGITEEKANG